VQQATGFTAPDKQEPLRRQAAALFKELCGKLDALSSFAFAPKPVVEELEVRVLGYWGFGQVAATA
jgi:U3 small nucleolar RNA-associated protein MPP10